MKRRKYVPPEKELIRTAITGNIVALFDIRAHYDRFMRYELNKEITAMAETFCLPPEMFDYENILGDMGIILDEAVMNFEE